MCGGGAEVFLVKRLHILHRVGLQFLLGRENTAEWMLRKQNLQEALSGERTRLCLFDGQLAAKVGFQARDFRSGQRRMLEHIAKKRDELRSEIGEDNPADACKRRAAGDFKLA